MSLDRVPGMPKQPTEAMENPTGGSIPMNIGGRMAYERERCIGMTDAERKWRAQFLKDQILIDEPVIPPNYYKERYNPIRRFYRAPMDKFQSLISSKWGANTGLTCRTFIATLSLTLTAVYTTYYYIKYHEGDWTRKAGPRILISRMAVYPGDPGYPSAASPKAKEYATYRFEESPI